MMNHLPVTRPLRTWPLLVAIGLLSFVSGSAAAPSETEKSGDTYTWSAELVEIDDQNNSVTVKAMMVGKEIDDWSGFAKGDRIILTWSGIYSASGVRTIAHPEANLEAARFMMPVEFISEEMDGRYVTFRVPIPETDVASVASLTPGEWVTATSSHDVSGEATVVTHIRPYTSVS